MLALALAAVAAAAKLPASAQHVLQADAGAEAHGVDPDAARTTMELAIARGYPVEAHTALTADGYRLTLHRLPPKGKANGKVVVLQHGLMDTSATWLLNTATDSLGFVLSTAGYDVWLANSRGNRYTERVSGGSTWAFDFDEMAYYDVPATLAYVLSRTAVKRVNWVCHSQGCAISIAAFAKPSAGALIDRFAALAPVTFLAHQSSPLMRLMVAARLDHVLRLLPAIEFVPSGVVLSKLLGAACTAAPGVCDGVVSGLFGATGANLPAARTGVYYAHFPDGTSTQNIAHWVANARSGAYANAKGEPYDLTAYAVRTAVWYGSKDMLANPQDVQTLLQRLGGLGGKNVAAAKQNAFAHMDFTWSPNAQKEVYAGVLTFLATGAL